MPILHGPNGPTFDLQLAGGRVRALCVASMSTDWSLKDIYDQAGADRNPDLVAHLRSEFLPLGVTRAYGPSVAPMSGAIVDPGELTSRIVLDEGLELFRNRDLPSDGIWLEPGEAFVMSGGGCPVAIAEGGGICLVAHVGRESAIDRERLLGRTPKRKYMSVIDAMAMTACRRGVEPRDMTLRVLFQIPTSLFAHPLDDAQHGEAHRAILRYAQGLGESVATVRDGNMHLSMHELVMAQGRLVGFRVDDVDHALPEDGPFGHTRHPVSGLRDQRNLVTVLYQ